jgi:integrase
MQRGYIRRHGNNWVLRYRAKVWKHGELKTIDQYHALAPVDRDHQPKQDGSAPEKVQALADIFLAPINAGTHRPQSADLVRTFLESFLAKKIGGSGEKLSNNSIRNYRASFQLVKEHLGDLELRKTRTPEINHILRMVQQSRPDLAHTTYRNLKTFLSSAFRDAVGHGLIDFNPVRDSVVVRGKPSDTYAYSLKETKAIVNALTDPIAKNAVMIFAFSGLRQEEVKGLMWGDWKTGWKDYAGDILDIQRAVVNGEVVTTKTLYSKAPVPIISLVKQTLTAHLKENTGDGFIFHGDTGAPIHLHNLVSRKISPVLEHAGIEWHGFHAFRRGLDTTLKDLGVDHSTRVDIMRHTPKNVTDRHYGKASLKRMRAALERVERKYKTLK